MLYVTFVAAEMTTNAETVYLIHRPRPQLLPQLSRRHSGQEVLLCICYSWWSCI